MGGCGTYTDALGFGGVNPVALYASTEEWNGASWAETSNLSTARTDMANVLGASVLGLCAGGNTQPAQSALTEEWNNPSTVVKTLTD